MESDLEVVVCEEPDKFSLRGHSVLEVLADPRVIDSGETPVERVIGFLDLPALRGAQRTAHDRPARGQAQHLAHEHRSIDARNMLQGVKAHRGRKRAIRQRQGPRPGFDHDVSVGIDVHGGDARAGKVGREVATDPTDVDHRRRMTQQPGREDVPLDGIGRHQPAAHPVEHGFIMGTVGVASVPGMRPRRVVVLRGTAANPWDLRPWENLREEFDITVLVPANNAFDTRQVALRRVGIRTVGAHLTGAGALGRLPVRAVGERYLGLPRALAGADIVHAAELGTWYAAQAARLRRRLGFALAVTVWETLPFLDAYRNLRTRPYRRQVLDAADIFLPATERARSALLLEGAPAERIHVCPPGVDLARYAAARAARADRVPGEPLVLSIGRLVWEKGHQDLLRAVALIRQRGGPSVSVLIVGTGPEEDRLRRVITDLALEDAVEIRGWVPHHELDVLYARASCLVLASEPTWYWEEQFGMVLIEAMAAHLPIVASASGAIPEVLSGTGTLFSPGDWVGLADALENGALSDDYSVAPPSHELLERYSADAAAMRLRAAYRELATLGR
jgi:glycosyltransferase involved in cell wall biosynthesis